MAISKDKWLEAKTLYELGNSLSEISNATGIDRSSISKKAKLLGWEHGKIQQLKNEKVTAITNLIDVEKKFNSSVELNQQAIVNREIMAAADIKVRAGEVQHSILDLIELSTKQAAKAIESNPSGFHVKSDGVSGTTYGRNTEIIKDLAPALSATSQIIHGDKPGTAIQINNSNRAIFDISIPDDPVEAARIYQDFIQGK